VTAQRVGTVRGGDGVQSRGTATAGVSDSTEPADHAADATKQRDQREHSRKRQQTAHRGSRFTPGEGVLLSARFTFHTTWYR
jgi:hypothetical protein